MTDKVFVGKVVLNDRILDRGWILVADDRIARIGSGNAPAGETYGDADALILPGAIDGQVHSRSQAGQEDFIWSTRSAAASPAMRFWSALTSAPSARSSGPGTARPSRACWSAWPGRAPMRPPARPR